MDRKSATSKRYPDELKERAVKMVLDLQRSDPNDHGMIARVSRQLGIGAESLRSWVKRMLAHIIGIPIDGTSVNPARSLGPALFVGGCISALVYQFLYPKGEHEASVEPAPEEQA